MALIGLELFSGAGGLSLGAEMAGLKTAYAIESSKSAAETFALNHSNTKVINCDVRAFDPTTLEFPNDGVILFGGPPCQGFSTSNQKTRNKNNPMNWLMTEFIRFAKIIKPRAVVFENVSGIVHTSGGFFHDMLLSSLNSLGYHTTWAVINAADVGVPQNRNRFFCVGCLDRPVLIHDLEKCATPVTVLEAIHDLPILEVGNLTDVMPYRTGANSRYARTMRGNRATCGGNLVTRNAPHIVERYSYIPEGGNWSNIPRELMTSYADTQRCHTGIYRRLKQGEPSVVIGNFRKNMLVHPTQNRGLSVREAARLQSFPDWYTFTGTIGLQQQQVGNAVPPLVSHRVFQQVVNALKSGNSR